MNKKLIIIFLLFLIPAFALYLLWPSDESRIKKLFKEGAGSIESRDLDGVMSKVSFNYRDEHGMTYLFIREMLGKEFKRLSGIHVEYEDLKIRISEYRGIAELNIRVVATIGNETGYIIGDVRTPLHLSFTLEKERMKWLIVRAEGFEF